MRNAQAPIWTRDFSLLWLANLLVTVSFYCLLPTLPPYVVQALGADNSQVGFLIGVYALSAVLVRPLAGYALDAVGRRGVYLWALAGFALFMAAYPLASGLPLMLLIRVLHGLTWGAATSGGGTAVADLVPVQRRGEGVGYYGMSLTLAMALGPMLGLAVAAGGYPRLFLTAAALAAAGLAFALPVRYPRVALAAPSFSWSAFYEHRASPVALTVLCFTLTYGGIVSFITLYSTAYQVGNSGVFFLAYAVTMTLSRPVAGRLLDRRGPTAVLTAGFLAMMAGFLFLAAGRTPAAYLGAAALTGIGMGTVMPTLQTMVINLVAAQRRGVATSTFFAAVDLGIGFGSIALGWLAAATSLAAMYLASALILALPLAYLHLHVLRHYRRALQPHPPSPTP